MKLGTSYKRKAKNALKQTVYMALWHEEVPKRYKRTCGKRKETKEGYCV